MQKRKGVYDLSGAIVTNDEARLRKALKDVFGLADFRPGQLDACLSVMSGKQTFVMFPTGAGKSLCYQLPAVVLPGVTLIVSPLVALMGDQVQALKSRGINADFYASTLPAEEKKRIKDALFSSKKILDEGRSYLVYVTPELLGTDQMKNAVNKMSDMGSLALVAFDEAHCVVEWGKSFRADYLNLGWMASLPRIRVIALTASATEATMQDILKALHMTNCSVFRSSFNRPNIDYSVRFPELLLDNGVDQFQDLLEWIRTNFADNASGIVYCRKSDVCEVLAERLTAEGIPAGCYHSKHPQKASMQARWMDNTLRVIVATIGFGMGIDKADVRFVVNYTVPSSMAEFYQMSGRAGRDQKQSKSLVYFSMEEARVLSFLLQQERQENVTKGLLTEKAAQEKFERCQSEAEQMIHWCTSSDCRRKNLLAFFGEKFNQSNCKSCDCCLHHQRVSRDANEIRARMDMPRGGAGGPWKKQRVADPKDGEFMFGDVPMDDHGDVRGSSVSRVGPSIKTAQQLLEEKMEARLARATQRAPLQVEAIGRPVVTKDIIPAAQRKTSVDFLRKAIEESNAKQGSTAPPDANEAAIKEEELIYESCKTKSLQAYKAAVISKKRSIAAGAAL